MEMFKIGEYAVLKNPAPGKPFIQHILTDKQGVVNFQGMFRLLSPGEQVVYHLHNDRESLIIAISGKATEIVEGKEFPVDVNDVMYIPAKEKHGLINTSDDDFRYLEFYTGAPGTQDRVELEWPEGMGK